MEMDATGRVLIAPELREWAGLERDVLLVGMGSRFELWDKVRHDAHEATVLAAGMLFTGLLGMFLLVVIGRGERVQQLVDEQAFVSGERKVLAHLHPCCAFTTPAAPAAP